MKQTRPIALVVFVALGLFGAASCVSRDAAPAATAGGDVAPEKAPAGPPAPAVDDSIARPQMPLVATPDPVRGLYVNRWVARGERMWELLNVARSGPKSTRSSST